MSVPNTNNFSLQDVIDEINPSSNDLATCFAEAIDSGFDSAYEGSKNSLLNFRNYTHQVKTITWTLVSNMPTNNWKGGFIDSSQALIVSNNGTNRLAKTFDGTNWTSQALSTSAGFTTLTPLGNSSSNYVAIPANSNTGARSTNSSSSWSNISIPNDMWLSANRENGGNTGIGIAVGKSGARMRTNDYGITWHAISSFGNYDLNHIVRKTNGFIIVGNHGFIITVSSNGLIWSINDISSISEEDLFGVDVKGSIAIACGTNGTILKSTNGGNDWSLLTLGITMDCKSITYDSNNDLWVAVGDNKIAVSTDDGLSWSQGSLPVSKTNWKIGYMSLYNKYVIFADGVIYTGVLG